MCQFYQPRPQVAGSRVPPGHTSTWVKWSGRLAVRSRSTRSKRTGAIYRLREFPTAKSTTRTSTSRSRRRSSLAREPDGHGRCLFYCARLGRGVIVCERDCRDVRSGGYPLLHWDALEAARGPEQPGGGVPPGPRPVPARRIRDAAEVEPRGLVRWGDRRALLGRGPAGGGLAHQLSQLHISALACTLVGR